MGEGCKTEYETSMKIDMEKRNCEIIVLPKESNEVSNRETTEKNHFLNNKIDLLTSKVLLDSMEDVNDFRIGEMENECSNTNVEVNKICCESILVNDLHKAVLSNEETESNKDVCEEEVQVFSCDVHNVDINEYNNASDFVQVFQTVQNLIDQVVRVKNDDEPNSKSNFIAKLKSENLSLKASVDEAKKLYINQTAALEQLTIEKNNDVKKLEESLKEHADLAQKNLLQLKEEYESKLDKINKKYEVAIKERESMVMKYAVSEKSAIDLKREIQSFENKVKDMIKEKEANQLKMKLLVTEKSKLHQVIDNKSTELAMMEREHQKRKDEIQMRDSKIKWGQNRLKMETDSHAETHNKLEKLQQKFNEFKEETEQFKKHTQAIIKNYQEAHETKMNMEQEEKAKLIIDRHDEENMVKLQSEIDNLKKKQKNLVDENNVLCMKVQNLEKERLEHEQNLSAMRQSMDAEGRKVADLITQLSDLKSTKLLLVHEQERLTVSQKEVERLRLTNADLQQEMGLCREREAELLDFTQKLTEKNVRLQSEFTAIDARTQELQIEHTSCQSDKNYLETKLASLSKELETERRLREEEQELASRKTEDLVKRNESLAQELADLRGENQLMKKKNAVTLKELSKELSACRKKLETYESANNNGPFGEGSRTSSTVSLNVDNSESNCSNHQGSCAAIAAELDPQILIHKLVEIQKSNASKAEKLEFFKEHVQQLVAELQKKTKIIQNYVIREQTGALSSETMDHYKAIERKHRQKAALSKHGGIMASVYNSKAADEGMTLEFSLKINKKLQAVLEDTLLKNITLKENLETLGNEIARLTSSNEVSKKELQ